MKVAVAILLGVLAAWSFSALVRQIAWTSYKRRAKTKPGSTAETLYRDVFHFAACVILLILLIQDHIAPVIVSIMTAVLFVGFEYALAIMRKWRR